MKTTFTLALVLGVFGLQLTAHAAPRKSKPQAVETYSAIEPEAPAPLPAAVAAPTSAAVASPSAPAATTTTAAVAPKATPAKKVPSFDAVPESQKGSLRDRLALVDLLINKYGRAYDYRTMTISQLQAVLATLARKQSQSAVAPAAPAPIVAPEGQEPSSDNQTAD